MTEVDQEYTERVLPDFEEEEIAERGRTRTFQAENQKKLSS